MTGKPAKPSSPEQAARLQQALRANLRRRKEQDHIPADKKKAGK